MVKFAPIQTIAYGALLVCSAFGEPVIILIWLIKLFILAAEIPTAITLHSRSWFKTLIEQNLLSSVFPPDRRDVWSRFNGVLLLLAGVVFAEHYVFALVVLVLQVHLLVARLSALGMWRRAL